MTKYIALDLETTGIRTDHTVEKIHCVGLYDNIDGGCVVEWGERAENEVLELLNAGYNFVMHHAEFDVRVLRQHGVNIPKDRYVCTQVLAHAINPQLNNYSLDALTGGDEKLDYADMMGYKKGDPALYDIPFNPKMEKYCAKDTELCWELWERYLPHLAQDQRLSKAYFTVLMPFVEVMMSLNGGMEVDAQAMMKLLLDITEEINTKYAEFLTEYPQCPKFKWDKVGKKWTADGTWKEPSLSSPNDVSSLLFYHGWVPDDYKRGTERPVTSQNVLRRLVLSEDTSPQLRAVASKMVDIRSLVGIQTQCISLLKIVTATNSTRIYGDWRQTGTVTHRLSSSKPNCQNFATRHPVWGKRMRKCFTPPQGYSMLVGDLAQIELAILAYYLEIFCDDSGMANAAREQKDFHTANTENWYHLDKGDEGFDEMRAKAKNGIFATNYGASAKRVSLTLNISVTEALEVVDTVNSNIEVKQLKEVFWQTLVTERPIKAIPHLYRRYTNGVFYDYMGVRHFYPGINSRDKYEVSSAKRQAFNCLMQGGCFSIFAHLLNQLLPHINECDGWIAGVVHDEAILYVPTQYAESVRDTANKIFSSFTMDTPQGGIPVRAEFKIVNDWSGK
jgi:DNA polymerase I